MSASYLLGGMQARMPGVYGQQSSCTYAKEDLSLAEQACLARLKREFVEEEEGGGGCWWRA
jgi:hypothetical protein